MHAGSYREVMTEIVRVLARDFACPEEAFHRECVSVYEAREVAGRRAFPYREHALGLATLGRGVVVTASRDRIDWVRRVLSGLGRDDVFSPLAMSLLQEYVSADGQSMAGPDLKYVCTTTGLQRHAPPNGIEVATVEHEGMAELYSTPGFNLALRYDTDGPRPDVLATCATVGGEVVGIAGATADCEELWQLGIEVLPAYQGRGVGKVLVSELAVAILENGPVPYYSTAVGNVHSQALAVACGFVPTWTELYAR